jgi:hypothetical protein
VLTQNLGELMGMMEFELRTRGVGGELNRRTGPANRAEVSDRGQAVRNGA